jgi:hypothetical protein
MVGWTVILKRRQVFGDSSQSTLPCHATGVSSVIKMYWLKLKRPMTSSGEACTEQRALRGFQNLLEGLDQTYQKPK